MAYRPLLPKVGQLVRPPRNVRRAAPWVMSGVSGMHIMLRVWRVYHAPARELAWHQFLLANSDILLLICGNPVVWAITRRRQRQNDRHPDAAAASIAARVGTAGHQLRQVFTTLLLGLGMIRRKAMALDASEILRLVERLNHVVAEGIEIVDVLDPPFQPADRSDGQRPSGTDTRAA